MSRRQMLQQAAMGFGAVAATALMSQPEYGALLADDKKKKGPFDPKETHYEAKVKNVIYLYMDGGPSQVDTFDPKPMLAKENGKPFKMKIEPTQFNNIGKTLQSPWKFKQHGKSGTPVSELFPYVAAARTVTVTVVEPTMH